jgi:hypothetical protein
MKIAIILVVALSSLMAMASGMTVRETLRGIESERNVKCEFSSASLAVCLGNDPEYKICKSTSTYVCQGAEEKELIVKLKIKSSFDYSEQERASYVTGIIYE